jgi:hypothetical protein
VSAIIFTAIDGAPAQTSEVSAADEKPLEKGYLLIAEKEIGEDGGRLATTDLVLNVRVEAEEGTFDEDAKLFLYYLETYPEFPSFERIGPVWFVGCEQKLLRKMRYTFQYEKDVVPPEMLVAAEEWWRKKLSMAGFPPIDFMATRPESASVILVLTWWRNNWVIAGIPHVNDEGGTVTIEADHGGYFVPVRTKLRDEIDIRAYTFSDGEKRTIDVIGYFDYRSKCREGEETLEESMTLREYFRGEIVFGPIPGTRRTGISQLYAGSVGDPEVLSYSGRLATPKGDIFATSLKVPEERGLISAKQENGLLNFNGLPTVVRLTGLHEGKEGVLPTMRPDLNFSGIIFDWRLQELFHLKNFAHHTQMEMPHGLEGESTILDVYLQFLIR